LSVIEAKMLLLECLIAEARLAQFLNVLAKRYEIIIAEEEKECLLNMTERVCHFAERVEAALATSDGRYHHNSNDSSDDKETETVPSNA
jgi:16S rRNA G1207 methylase RsmC